jgi:predicted small lipoprotein YifL
MRRPTLTLAALLAVVLLAGCGLRDPYAQPASTEPTTPPATTRAATEGRSAGRSAGQALALFTALWVNWSAGILPAERRALLGLAWGQLAGELRRDAAQAARAQLQELSGAYSRGRLIGVIHQATGQIAVVTFEQASAQGGPPQSAYHVYLARTEHTTGGWRVVEWQPASEG